VCANVCYRLIEYKMLMEGYNFFKFFFNDKLITAFKCFGGHIYNKAARIRDNKSLKSAVVRIAKVQNKN
jgi:hypothetical protein